MRKNLHFAQQLYMSNYMEKHHRKDLFIFETFLSLPPMGTISPYFDIELPLQNTKSKKNLKRSKNLRKICAMNKISIFLNRK